MDFVITVDSRNRKIVVDRYAKANKVGFNRIVGMGSRLDIAHFRLTTG